MKKLLYLWLLLFAFTSCNSQSCDQVNNKPFKSYSEAKEFVETYEFKFAAEEDLERSSWMRKANFYSCDGEVGYFVYETKNGETYIYRNLPIYVWNGFKKANSPGSFYNDYIKGNYILTLNK